MKPSEWIWFDGEWVKWAEATVHVSVHALHYGSSVFEGVRAYDTPRGPAAFRLADHTRRLWDSARLLRLDLAPWNEDQINEACLELIRRNGHKSCYLRPIAFRGSGSLGVNGQELPT
ncbi:MAG: aminotransferase class IV, partial [Acidobacteriota bacterium]